jgi:hypothetical protein
MDRQLVLMEGIQGILTYLRDHMPAETDANVLLSAGDVRAAARWNHGQMESESMSLLRALAVIQIAELRLGRQGWDPRFVRQSAAVTELEQNGPGTFRVRISPLLPRVISAFGRPWRAR